jgi:5S rRNA maturation endonuclease (ribonuclease M5)
MKLQHYLDQLENVKKIGENQYSAKCPNHDDRNNSLTISEREGKILVHCFAGCEFEEIMKHFREETRTWTNKGHNTHSNLGYIRLQRQSQKEFIDKNDHFGRFMKDHFGGGTNIFDYDSQSGRTQFWYVNKEGRDVNAKCIRYTEAIKRDRATDPCWKAPFNRLKEKKCWFNEHKIVGSINIIIVESEKTAVLLQAVIEEIYQEYIIKADKPVVISTGGSTGYTNTDYEILKNKRVMILPDNDEPGIKMAVAIKNILESQGTGCKTLEIDYLQGDKPAGYDIADYITENIENKSLLYAYFEMLVETFNDIDLNIDPENNILSFGVFSQICNSMKRQDIVANLLPERGLASIVGAPDTGKSQFARQLSLCVCCGLDEFLGTELRTDTKKVLYVATEESNETITSGIKKQIIGLDLEGSINEINSNLEILCFTGSDLAGLLKRKTCTTKYDLIVIDSFGDIFHSGDISNNTDIRRLLNEYYSITTQHKTLILFIHHITKSSYKQKPEQASQADKAFPGFHRPKKGGGFPHGRLPHRPAVVKW